MLRRSRALAPDAIALYKAVMSSVQGNVEPSEAALFASIEQSPIATVVTDPRQPDNPIVAANDAFSRLTLYAREEIIGRNCRFLAGPDTDPAGSTVLREAVATARPAITEILNYRKDGSSFWNAVMVAPVFAADGNVAYFIGSQVDVGANPAHPAVARSVEARKRIDALTPRQMQVLKDMSLGYRNKQIAHRLGIDEKTVKMHRASLIRRLGAPTSADAIRIAVEAGL
jgi:PAS domain S-box-containing protein